MHQKTRGSFAPKTWGTIKYTWNKTSGLKEQICKGFLRNVLQRHMNTSRALQSTVSVTGLSGDLFFSGICQEPRNNAWCTWRTQGLIDWVSKERFLQWQLLLGQSIGRWQHLSEGLVHCSLTGFLFKNLLRTEEFYLQLVLRLQQDLRCIRSPLSFPVHTLPVYKTAHFYCLILKWKFQKPWARRSSKGINITKGSFELQYGLWCPGEMTWGSVQETFKNADSYFLN